MNYVVNINSRALIAYTAKLERMSRSALPVAVRGTLNKAAFNVKQVTMPQSAENNFIRRRPNFFKANSKVVMANGFDVNSMRSTVGFISSNLQYNNFAVRELEQQEYGGDISNRTFVPLDTSRSGGAHASNVLPSNRIGKKTMPAIFASKMRGKNRREKFVKAAIVASRYSANSAVFGRYVVGNLGRKSILYRINSIKTSGVWGGRTIVKKTPLYSFDEGRSVKIKNATHFMREASLKTADNLDRFFIAEAHRQFARIR